MKDKGFSLVELIIVVAIMAILIGVLAPQYIKYVERSRKSSDENNAESILDTAHVMVSDENWCEGLSDGSTIVFDTTGITTSDSSMDAALDELYSKWRDVKVKSKVYQSKSYTVKFTMGSNGIFTIVDGWN